MPLGRYEWLDNWSTDYSLHRQFITDGGKDMKLLDRPFTAAELDVIRALEASDPARAEAYVENLARIDSAKAEAAVKAEAQAKATANAKLEAAEAKARNDAHVARFQTDPAYRASTLAEHAAAEQRAAQVKAWDSIVINGMLIGMLLIVVGGLWALFHDWRSPEQRLADQLQERKEEIAHDQQHAAEIAQGIIKPGEGWYIPSDCAAKMRARPEIDHPCSRGEPE
jgi:hypothetical protein